MTDTFKLQEVNFPEIFATLTEIVVSPVIIPVADAVKQPLVKTVIQEGRTFIEKCQEAITNVDNSGGNIKTDLFNGHQKEFIYPYSATNGKSEVANDLINVISDINADVGRMTDGVADLRLLLPLGFSLLAIRQLLVQGLKLNDIPWYILAWFAFDSFIKLNNTSEATTYQDRETS